MIRKKSKILFFIILTAFLIINIFATDSIVKGIVRVKGVKLKIEPIEQTVPIGTPTIIKTVFTCNSVNLLKGMVIKGELEGPGINGSITYKTLPNHPFSIPGFNMKGKYILKNIRLEKEGKILARPDEDSAIINVEDIIVTSIKTRPLTLEEIKAKGIVITEDNFKVYNFAVGFVLGSKKVTMDFPVVYTGDGRTYVPRVIDIITPHTPQANFRPPNISFKLPHIDLPEIKDHDKKKHLSQEIGGILVFNNKIAFLHQFFSIMFIITNNAPKGSELKLKDIEATISFPEGLREAKTNPPHIKGKPIPVRCPGPDGKLGTGDDITIILATFSGMAEFLAEGLKKGTHIVKVDFRGKLSGLPEGDVEFKGTANGAVLVRDPKFSIVFSHPSVVRSGEEYDIYITMTNTSPVTANLVSLVLPKNRLIGTELLSSEKVNYETIKPGETRTAKFHLVSRTTGKVKAAAFEADGSVTGKFILRVGVGEKNIPLSPDTIIMPPYTYKLPSDLLEPAILLIGEAYSIATTPASALPQDLPYVSMKTVKLRTLDLARAGRRYDFGDSLINSVDVLILDWLGNDYPNISFDILRRLTTKGLRFAEKLEELFNNEIGNGTLFDFQRKFAETTSYKKPFLSMALSGTTGTMEIIDYYNNSMSIGDTEKTRDIPFGEIFSLKESGGDRCEWGLIGNPDFEDGRTYKIKIKGKSAGTVSLSMIIPANNNKFKQVLFNNIKTEENSISELIIDITKDSFEIKTDLNGDGTIDETVEGVISDIIEPPLKLISAVQDCFIDSDGQAVSLLFNRAVDFETYKNTDNYQCERKTVQMSFRQTGGRFVVLNLDSAVSPFFETKIKVSDIKDIKGNLMEPSPTELKIRTTIKDDGGIVYGKFMRADGSPITGARIVIRELIDISSMGMPGYLYSYAKTDSKGDYIFEYIKKRDRLLIPPVLSAEIPETGEYETVSFRIRVHGQRVKIDIVLRGKGNIYGVVYDENNNPVPDAKVIATEYMDGQTGANTGVQRYLTTSDKNGEFGFKGIHIGPVSLYAVKGLSYGFSATEIKTQGEIVSHNIRIYPVANNEGTGTIKGRVFTDGGKTPVSGTSVRLAIARVVNGKQVSVYFGATTDSDGYFSFNDIPTGNYLLKVINPINLKQGYFERGELKKDEIIDKTIIFRGTGEVYGKVFDFAGNPLSGIIVYINGTPFNMKTGADGGFDFNNIPIGDNYNIIAMDSSGKTITKNFKLITEGQKIYISLIFPDSRKGGISGTLYDSNGNPLSSINVYLADGNFILKGSNRTDSKGRFSFTDLDKGFYVVAAQRGVDGKAENLYIKQGQFITKDLKLRGIGNIDIKIFASDGQTGIKTPFEINYPVFVIKPNDEIGITSERFKMDTDENGELSLKNIIVGNFSIKTLNPFYATKYYSGEIPGPGQTAEVKIIMEKLGNIKGKVYAPDGTTIVKNAKVELFVSGLASQKMFTDDNGEFEYSLVKRGGFQIIAEDQVNGYKGIKYGSMNTSGVLEIDVRLKGKGKVFGMVKDKSGNPVKNVWVELRTVGYPNEYYRKKSDDNGNFVFLNVSEGKITLNATTDDGLNGGSASGELVGNGNETKIDIILGPKGDISGKILSPDSSKIIPRAQVTLSYYFGNGWKILDYNLTGDDGKYRFENLPTRDYRIDVFEPATGRKAVAYTRINHEGELVEKNIPLKGRGSVSGVFTDSTGETPYPRIRVKLTTSDNIYNIQTETMTDDKGYFEFTGMGEGSFNLKAVAKDTGLIGYAEDSIDYDGQKLFINIKAEGSGTVRGTIYRYDGTTPVNNGKITIKYKHKLDGYNTILKTIAADNNGAYEFNNIPLTSFSLTAEDQGSRDRGYGSGKLTENKEIVEKNIKMRGLGTVKGVVKDAGGSTISDAKVIIRVGNEKFEISSDSNGEFEFPEIPVGVFTLEAKDEITGVGASNSGEIMSDGETVTVELILEAYGSVKGKVLNTDGTTPSEHAYIEIKRDGKLIAYDSTEADGSFEIKTVKLGKFDIFVTGFNRSGLYRDSGELTTHGQVAEFNNIILDSSKPEIIRLFPVNGSNNIDFNTPIWVEFSEPISEKTVNGNNILLSTETGRVNGTLSLAQDKKKVTFVPSSPLKSFTLYTLTVTDNIKDIAGNKLKTGGASSFVTTDKTPPTIISVDPKNNTIQIPKDYKITVVFSESIDKNSFVQGTNIIVLENGNPVNGTIEFKDNDLKLIYTISGGELKPDSTYTVKISGVKDKAGNTQSSEYSWSFKTIDTIPPSITLNPPQSGTTVIETSSVKITAVSQDTDIAKVLFYMNGNLIKTDTSAPFECTFTTPLISSIGSDRFTIEALPVDKAGNAGVQKTVEFTIISDTPPIITMTGPSQQNVYPGDTINYKIEASDIVLLKHLDFSVTGGNINYIQNINLNQKTYNRTFSITIPSDIAPGTEITAIAKIKDSGGNITAAPVHKISVYKDNNPPAINITTPTANTKFKYKQVIEIKADATDDVKVKKVSFYKDGELLSEDTQSPYTASFIAPAVKQDTDIIIKAVAADLTGKTAEKTVKIIIEKLVDTEPPEIKVLSPADESLVFKGEKLKIKAEVKDNNGIKKVEFLVDGTSVKEFSDAPYEFVYEIPSDKQNGDEIEIKIRGVDVVDNESEKTVKVKVIEGELLPDGKKISENDMTYENKTIIIKEGTITIDGSHTFKNVLVKESGILTHSPATTTKVYKMNLKITGKLCIGIDAKISVRGKGYLKGRTYGNTTEGASTKSSGGSYGGYGAKGGDALARVNELYGSMYEPEDPGSGGGGNGTSGGGVVKIEAEEIEMDGKILSGATTSWASGAGSGGSIWIKVKKISGSGKINANGGNANGYYNVDRAGGGGRVAVYYEDATGFDLDNITAFGGKCGNGSDSGKNGGAGTVYLKKTGEDGVLVIDNNGVKSSEGSGLLNSSGKITALSANSMEDSNASFVPKALVGMSLIPNIKNGKSYRIIDNTDKIIYTDPADGDMTEVASVGDTYGIEVYTKIKISNSDFSFKGYMNFNNLIISNSRFTVDGTLETDELTLENGAVLTHSQTDTNTVHKLNIKARKIIIDSTSKISVSGKGYLKGRTYGNTTEGASTKSSGGSYGGYGAKGGDALARVNELYGSMYEPEDPGSGGGGNGTSGGGVVKIEAEEIEMDGKILSGATTSWASGAGSGGSIWIKVKKISGSGKINANGGNANGYYNVDRAGGGGRVAVYYEDATGFDLDNITAFGGKCGNGSDSGKNGGAGTVYLKKTGEDGVLVIDNNGVKSSEGSGLLNSSGKITALSANSMEDSNASFVPKALVGMFLIPNINNGKSYRIIDNTDKIIYTDPADGDMRDVASVGDTYGIEVYTKIKISNSDFSFKGYMNFNNLIISNSRFTVDGTLETDELTLKNEAVLTHSQTDTNTVYKLNIKARKIIIDSTSSIDVSGKGYLKGRTYGNTTEGASTKSSGGSYGGYGAKGGDALARVNELYGSMYEPEDPGSGGGGNGTSGGGVIKIEAEEIEMDGKILSSATTSWVSGAGSGGSIWIKVKKISGSGKINANGGNANGYYNVDRAGGGGRVAVYYEDATGFDLDNITAFGGKCGNGSNSGKNGGAGTVYLKKSGEEGVLVIDNNGVNTVNNKILPSVESSIATTVSGNKITSDNANYLPNSLIGVYIYSETHPEQTFKIISNTDKEIEVVGDISSVLNSGERYRGRFILSGDMIIRRYPVSTISGEIELGNLTIKDNSTLTHPQTNTGRVYKLNIKVKKIIIDSTSKISVSGKGYLGSHKGDNNSDYGKTLGNFQGSGQYAGGSYGGYGGKYDNNNSVNEIYGSIYEPEDPGSGSARGNLPSSSGGGVIKIDAEEMEIEGGIYSNGEDFEYYYGGSGGSIWIKVKKISGSGKISANGDKGIHGGGGGGRVAVYYEDATGFDLDKITAYGGRGDNAMHSGGAGTVYLKKSGEEGVLVIDNNGIATPSNGYSTKLPAVELHDNESIYPHKIVIEVLEGGEDLLFTGKNLIGIKIDPDASSTTSTDKLFTIIGNDDVSIWTDPADGDMTQYSSAGYSFIGVYYLEKIIVKGKARVFTNDRIILKGAAEVETGSALKAENMEIPHN